jgi:predicted RNA binding protein YcfA (HicA-like mRNA interferase family)
MTAGEVIERNGGILLRQCGSHRQYEARVTLADGTEIAARTTVAQHAGDVRPGTLRAIERDLEPVFGKGWLKGR